ncbi:MAG TPA: DMT family transporter [Alphaproteobacteria bacterium]
MKQMGETAAALDRPHLDATAMSTMVVLCALWGLQQVAIKVANAGISPVLQAGLRSAGAAVLIWIWAATRGIRLVDRNTPMGLAILIGVLFGAEFLLIYQGLTFTTASRSVILLYTAPFFVAIGAHLFIPGERLRLLQWFGLASAFGGIVVTFGDALRLPTRHELIGDAMIICAAALWAATTVVIKATRLRTLEPSKTLFYQLAVSGAALPIAAVALGEPGITAVTPLVAASLFYQTVIVAFMSYLAWFWLVKHYPASRLSAFSFLTPLFGVSAGALLLSEPITTALITALMLVTAGIYLVNRRPSGE